MSGASVENWIDIPGVGALLGMAVGDALGTTYEFERIEQPPYPTLAKKPATDIVGGGPFDLKAGQILGALLGSRDGARAIPREWLERVLAATQPGPADWAEAHHPKHLLVLVQPAGR